MTIGGSNVEAELATLLPLANAAPSITLDERLARIERARRLTRDAGADALIVGAGASLNYFAGVSWGASERLVALLIPVTGDPVMICPAFELGSLSAETVIDAEFRLWEEHESPYALVADALSALGATMLAVDPAMAFDKVKRLGDTARGVTLVDASPVIDGCRMCKSPAELALMKQAKAMTLAVHKATARILAPGITTTEVRRFIDQAHRRLGAAGSSFCIVQFGHATAYPHGIPGEQALAENDLVLIDTGCTVQGYHSDITRTYVFGTATDEQRRIWDLEHAAQAAAFEAVRPGLPCEAVDAAARDLVTRAGLGPDYKLPGIPHRTGHGIGLSIHEPAYLVRGDRTPLAPGMCFSNEPMIVVPEKFGIRLEDHFYVTENGAEWFTPPQPAIDAL
ncbi:M24 family metallopeptidase [Sphingomonas cavernae]|uniref:Aminopeptidase P family protein n=1 Tax=Sphingomonas cavernae TaxID=2320861 RepID=A0A418W728_9SPHN|nr:Xaa-Pro peptidase family protein [Sphingomonas cavernae]RJF85856.1 aminopeptidase P family protein [Sphingomonas cavernae]